MGRITVDEILFVARRDGLDPIEHARDLGDGYDWDEEMTEACVRAVAARIASTASDEVLVRL